MRPLPSVLIALALVLSATALALFIAGPPPSSVSSPPASTAVETAAPAPASPPASAPSPPAARVQGRPSPSVADAIKELDLVKPARPKAAEDFTVPTSTGEAFRLAEQRGKVVMVNFWATWCPPCLEEMPAMERLYRAHKDRGFVLLAVSVDANSKKVTPFVTDHKLTMPIGLDPKMDLANAYGVRALPSSFVVGRDGNLVALAIGPRHWDNQAAHALVQGMLR